MKFCIFIASVIAITVFCSSLAPPEPSPSSNSAPLPQTRVGPAAIYPDSSKTPGGVNPNITQANIAQNICNKQWSTDSVRPGTGVTNKIKKERMIAYGFTDSASDYELDHLLSLQNGGCPACLENLWPEAYGDSAHPMTSKARAAFNKTHPHSTDILPGALEKDLVENHIHDEICRDVPNARFSLKLQFPPTVTITLKRGQQILATDWYACYLNMLDGNKPCL